MLKEFRFEDYASTNSDLAEHFGPDNEDDLRRHFEEVGRAERRGFALADYINLDAILCSDRGDFLVSGWADRRVFPSLEISIQAGYLRYSFPDATLCWHDREDVNALIGDSDRPAGFVALLSAGEAEPFSVHSALAVSINGVPLYQQAVTRWLSPKRFLQEALGACAALADRPVGESLENGQRPHRGFVPVWRQALNRMAFTRLIAVGPDRPVRSSIVITIHRRADMLLVQLAELSAFLERAPVEVIVVLNDVADAPLLAEQLLAFCHIHPIALSLYSCTGNAGFSAANNFGARVARGKILVLMNPDIFPPAKHTEGSLAFLTSDPGDTLYGALLYYGDGMLMHSGMYVARDTVVHPGTGQAGQALRVEHFGKGLTHRIGDDQRALDRALARVRQDVCIPSAALWKVDRKRFLKGGGLSTDYLYAYYEDAAFGLDHLWHGGAVAIDRSARWIHMEGVGKTMPPHVRSFMWLNRCAFSERYAACPHVVDVAAEQALL